MNKLCKEKLLNMKYENKINRMIYPCPADVAYLTLFLENQLTPPEVKNLPPNEFLEHTGTGTGTGWSSVCPSPPSRSLLEFRVQLLLKRRVGSCADCSFAGRRCPCKFLFCSFTRCSLIEIHLCKCSNMVIV